MGGGLKLFIRRHIEPQFYKTLWVLSAVLTISLVVLFANGPSQHYQWIVLCSAGLGVVLATIGWVWTGRVRIEMACKSNALLMLDRLSAPEVFTLKTKAYEYMRDYQDWRKTVKVTDLQCLLTN